MFATSAASFLARQQPIHGREEVHEASKGSPLNPTTVWADDSANTTAVKTMDSIDLEAGLSPKCGFENQQDGFWYNQQVALRNGFLRKVYGILLAQILLTTGIVVLCMFEHTLQAFLVANRTAMFWGMFVPSIALIFLLFKVKNSHPANLIVLFTFTLVESFFLGTMCAIYKEADMGLSVLYAFIATCVVFVLLSLWTLQSKYDFSWMGTGLSIGLVLLIMWGLVNAIFGFQIRFLYGLFGALLFCGFIIYDTKQIQTKYGLDEYVVAAIELYLDFINLFVHILAMMGGDGN
jgi:FtsH-binding integral membrane protein